MPRPVADYLVEMSCALDTPAALYAAPANDLALIWPEEPQPDWQAALAGARDEGRAAALDAAAADYEEKLAVARKAFDADLAAARLDWADEEGQRLREQLDHALAEIEERLTEAVARVVRPFLIASLREQMIAKLIENVQTIVGRADHIAIRIAGPKDLLAAVRTKLDGSAPACEYTEQDSVDVSVTSDHTSIDTQLKAWIDLIGTEG